MTTATAENGTSKQKPKAKLGTVWVGSWNVWSRSFPFQWMEINATQKRERNMTKDKNNSIRFPFFMEKEHETFLKPELVKSVERQFFCLVCPKIDEASHTRKYLAN